MKIFKIILPVFAVFLIAASIIGCGASSTGGSNADGIYVVSTNPYTNQKDVARNTKVTVTFNVPMDFTTLTGESFGLVNKLTGDIITCDASGTGSVATFSPEATLASNTTYEATVKNAKDSGGKVSSGKLWSFMTGTHIDLTSPEVLSTNPASAETGVDVNQNIVITFDKEMQLATITTREILLSSEAGVSVAGVVTRIGAVATFNPIPTLDSGTTYEVTIISGASGVKDLAGNALAANYTWKFKTRASSGVGGPAPVDLGTAAHFAILAKSAITTTGTTMITGDCGVSPAAATTMTGFSLQADASNVFSRSIYVDGKLYAANYTPPTPINMGVSIGDMQAAYVDAAGRSLSAITELGAGNISGMTLAPGLYKWGTGLIVNGTITELAGGADDVWIFIVAKDLTVGNAAILNLSGGAQAKNIFWAIAGKVTLGTTSQFKGNILCKTQINMLTGAKLSGRALAQTQVTLQSNKVLKP